MRDPAAAAAGQHDRRRSFLMVAAAMLSCTALTAPAAAQDAPKTAGSAASTDESNDIVVTGSLNALPNKDVGSIFGFNKTLVETPRSASTISSEQIERFGVTNIYDLVAQAPGTFTNSFFGVGGALDIRGTPGETYFRGVRRLDNAGNYATPIGASDRIDIVRGPASPIYGPSKTGGYLNFVPKSARVKGGALLDHAEGEVSYTTGSWGKNNLKAQMRGPIRFGGTEFGYSIYAELENSGSYYRNLYDHETILQVAFDNQITDRLRIEFGGQYQYFDSPQNGGWNRLTQALVDDGTYITGAARPADTDADGQISQEEARAVGGLSTFGSFGCISVNGGFNPAAITALISPALTNACFQANFPQYSLTNVGTTTLSRRFTLTGENDINRTNVKTGYFDTIFDVDPTFQIKNQLFFDQTDNRNENSYGFSQFVKSYVIEDRIILAKSFKHSVGEFSFQVSPSIRYTNFHFGDDFDVELFHRVDLTVGYTPLSDRLLATECDCNFSNYVRGSHTDYGIAGLADLDFDFGLDLIVGGRYDSIDQNSRYDVARLNRVPAVQSASANEDGFSWTASASYKLPLGLIPYITASRQSTLVVGQGAEILPESIGSSVAASQLYEGGIKGSWLGGRLYAALSVYNQTRTDRNVQSITVNQSVETKGLEAEVRWAVNKHLFITGAYTMTKVYNLTFQGDGAAFAFYGIEDIRRVVPDTNPALYLGGQPLGLIPIPNAEASRRAGIPENLVSGTATYKFDNGFALNGSIVHVDSVFSGQSQAVRLPAYTLVDIGASFEINRFLFRVTMKNATDAKYFRANFTELFGSTIVLPERPRSFQASVAYKF